MKLILLVCLVICLTVHAVPATGRRKAKPRPALDNPASVEVEQDVPKYSEPLPNLIQSKASVQTSLKPKTLTRAVVEQQQAKHIQSLINQRGPSSNKASGHVSKKQKSPNPVDMEPEHDTHNHPSPKRKRPATHKANGQVHLKPKPLAPIVVEPDQPKYIEPEVSGQVSLNLKTPSPIVEPLLNQIVEQKHNRPSSKRRRPATNKASSEVKRKPKPSAPVVIEPEQPEYIESEVNDQLSQNLKTPSPVIVKTDQSILIEPLLNQIASSVDTESGHVQTKLISPAEANVEPLLQKHNRPSSKRRRPATHKASGEVNQRPKPLASVKVEPEELRYTEPLITNKASGQVSPNPKTPSSVIVEPKRLIRIEPLPKQGIQGPSKASVQISLKPKTPVAPAILIPDENFEVNIATASRPPLVKAVKLEPKRKQIFRPVPYVNRPIVGPVSTRIISNENEITKNGFSYSYETGNGIKSQVASKRVKLGKNSYGNEEEGSFEWTAPNNKRIHVVYTADAYGYHPIVTYQ